MKRPDNMKALEEATRTAGGASALARALGIAPSLVTMWGTRNYVPAEYCPAIERETGVACERLCPRTRSGKSIAWAVLRRSK